MHSATRLLVAYLICAVIQVAPCNAAEFLGFLNKTCNAGTAPDNYGSTAGPVLRAKADGTQWKQWIFKVLTKPDARGAVDVTVTNYYPSCGVPR